MNNQSAHAGNLLNRIESTAQFVRVLTSKVQAETAAKQLRLAYFERLLRENGIDPWETNDE